MIEQKIITISTSNIDVETLRLLEFLSDKIRSSVTPHTYGFYVRVYPEIIERMEMYNDGEPLPKPLLDVIALAKEVDAAFIEIDCDADVSSRLSEYDHY